MAGIQTVPMPRVRRIPRRPQHRFYLDAKPWEINPVVIAPVLPGETLKNMLLQARCVSSPLASNVVGWWLEYFFFYVTHRQMPASAAHIAMIFDPATVLAPSAAATPHYYGGLGYNWVTECLQVVVQEWFREQGEVLNPPAIRAGRLAAKVNFDGIHESMIDTTVLSEGGALGATQEAQDKALELYQYLQAMSFTRMTYEDWLATYGVSLPTVQRRDRPELLRYIRDWTYPNNTVEPTTGVPTTAVSWGIAERADKDRFFTEPGFIFGVQVVRPKIYFDNQTGFASSALDRVMRWMPAIMSDDPSSSLAEFTSAQGPFGKAAGGFTNGYWLDIRDLFIYGDQYVDAIRTDAEANKIALPTIAQIHRYATEAMANSLFFSSATEPACTLRTDGALALNILGTQVDHT